VTPNYSKYLVGQAIAGAVINLVLNGAIAWLLYRRLPRIPLHGPQSIAGDVVVTSFVLPLLICLIVTPLIRAEMRKERLPVRQWVSSGPHRAVRLPTNLLLRALVIGVLAALVVSPITIWALDRLVGAEGLAFWPFVVFKASLAAALAVVVTPILVMRTLQEGRATAEARPVRH
jgi:O-antigen/teichoic acid export membrane protein